MGTTTLEVYPKISKILLQQNAKGTYAL